jgi:hypothetical protein
MSYIIKKTDGTVLTEIIDGLVDQAATDLTLIGKNYSSYGTALNENFVYMLENFANISQPNNPIVGQLWFDTSVNRLQVYNGTGFVAASGAFISSGAPPLLNAGDLWVDSYNEQLHFYNGDQVILAGPIYNAQQGVSGFVVRDVLDVNNSYHTIVLLYVATALFGIYSTDEFVPLLAISGFTNPSIVVGFNSSTILRYDITALRAEKLVDDDGNEIGISASSFISTTLDSTMLGNLSILNDLPLVLGSTAQNSISVTEEIFQLLSTANNQNFEIRCYQNGVSNPNMHINTEYNYMGINTDDPSATLDVNGDLKIRGSLLISGVSPQLGLSANITGLSNVQIINNIINRVYPSINYGNGTACRIFGIDTLQVKEFVVTSQLWNFTTNIS